MDIVSLKMYLKNVCSVIIYTTVFIEYIQIAGGQTSDKRQDKNLIQRIKRRVSVSMSKEWPGWVASKAIDGNNSTKPGCNCCSLAYTSFSGDQTLWWELDLGMMYPIKRIQFFGENDAQYYNKFKGFNLSISNTSDATSKIFYKNDKNLPGNKFNIPVPNTLFRYIRITKTDMLLICEIKLLEGECRVGRFGDECGHVCHCADNLPCNRTTGSCQNPGCDTGWQGRACDMDCTTGYFGDGCGRNCHCNDNLQCHRITGMCQYPGCKIGWQGEACDSACLTHTYGVNCSGICGQCKGNSTCDSVTGACLLGCTAEYTGTMCISKIEDRNVPIIAIIGGVSAVVICGFIAIFCFLKNKKRKKLTEQRDHYTDLNPYLTPFQQSPYSSIDTRNEQDERRNNYTELNHYITPSQQSPYSSIDTRNEQDERGNNYTELNHCITPSHESTYSAIENNEVEYQYESI